MPTPTLLLTPALRPLLTPLRTLLTLPLRTLMLLLTPPLPLLPQCAVTAEVEARRSAQRKP